MFVTPVPRLGDVVVGRDGVGRVLRVSAHPNSGRVVLSIWQEGTCLGTVRLAAEDVGHLVAVLTGLGAVLDPGLAPGLPPGSSQAVPQGIPQAYPQAFPQAFPQAG